MTAIKAWLANLKKLAVTSALVCGLAVAASARSAPNQATEPPLVIARQGSFFVGGRAVQAPGVYDPTDPAQGQKLASDGEIFHIDHLYAQFQIPVNARRYPLVLIHGGGQTGKTWESTPDGRDGYQTIFLRRGFAVYIVDNPRRGRAGYPSFNGPLGALMGEPIIPDLTTRVGDKRAATSWRLGPEPSTFYPNSQFPKAGLEQFFRQGVPFTPDDRDIISSAQSALLDKIGPAILVVHSSGALPVWMTAMKNPSKVKGVVAYEPFTFVFPKGELPPPLSTSNDTPKAAGVEVAPDAFMKLTRIPIQIVYGDNIPTAPDANLIRDDRRTQVMAAKLFVEAINRHGGDASFMSLPEQGLHGNTHFPFADLNNIAVADLMARFLRQKNLDRR